ncbi:DUF2487 family protein [Paenibacillus sp. 32352]|uniref:DUF2487 family protein n=1 Tax=Paenibacillus sp. 32352 TaxID=1969111 RepID=UPI0009AC6C25|nr:DUF2487 family protein [Paenibacillus sp. 32352]
MKFSDVESASWEELRPYVDTCLLPVTGLTGSEQPWEATQALEKLRDALDCFEIPYKGRVLTYPAFHYIEGEEGKQLLINVCERLKQSFPYLILVSASNEIQLPESGEAFDLAFILTPDQLGESSAEVKQNIASQLQSLWAQK